MKRGLLLFAHGARDPRWSAPFDAIAARIRESDAGLAVELAYLELMSPTLGEAAARLAAAGCTTVDVVPLFLGAGGHVRKDLPALLEPLRPQHAHIVWRLRPAIGEVDAVVEAMARATLRMVADGSQSAASTPDATIAPKPRPPAA